MTDHRTCPNCDSAHVRRGGRRTWGVYLALVAAGLLAVLAAKLNAGLVAGIMIAAIVIAHLVLNERVCLDCGHQWRSQR
ncbi:MAG TPA: hypothetical protein VEZ11_06015 [Thermoanaerobaculia bacterium]|nr:hypothetical protein [Thermoanaerobaculia bacterium]